MMSLCTQVFGIAEESEDFGELNSKKQGTQGERLSWKSSVLPWDFVSENGVEDGE